MALILVVDDEASIRRMLRETLVREGHEVIEAERSSTDLRMIEHRVPDLVVTDLMMPEKDGLELLLDLRRAHPEMRVVAISGGGRNAWSEALDVAKRFGAFRTLAKPFSLDEFVAVVREALNRAA